jgi:4-phospho-D-threonate 3-dehydrogenase / 4-phospho-D-erythronate 3-dehydrogenase
MSAPLPILALTSGDPAGTGPELIAKALALPEVRTLCRPLVIGDAAVLERALGFTGVPLTVRSVDSPEAATYSPDAIEVLDLKLVDIARLPVGRSTP